MYSILLELSVDPHSVQSACITYWCLPKVRTKAGRYTVVMSKWFIIPVGLDENAFLELLEVGACHPITCCFVARHMVPTAASPIADNSNLGNGRASVWCRCSGAVHRCGEGTKAGWIYGDGVY
jgi:hypothetical protein